MSLLSNFQDFAQVIKLALSRKADKDEVSNTVSQAINSLSAVAKTGRYDDLSNKPTYATVANTGDYNDLNSKPQFASVATTGSYNSLSDKPSLSAVATTGSYTDLSDKPEVEFISVGISNIGTNSAALDKSLSDIMSAVQAGKRVVGIIKTSGMYETPVGVGAQYYALGRFGDGDPELVLRFGYTFYNSSTQKVSFVQCLCVYTASATPVTTWTNTTTVLN